MLVVLTLQIANVTITASSQDVVFVIMSDICGYVRRDKLMNNVLFCCFIFVFLYLIDNKSTTTS